MKRPKKQGELELDIIFETVFESDDSHLWGTEAKRSLRGWTAKPPCGRQADRKTCWSVCDICVSPAQDLSLQAPYSFYLAFIATFSKQET